MNGTTTSTSGGTDVIDLFTYLRESWAPYLRALLGRSERGATLVEYALLLALIAVVCIVAITFLGGNARSKFSDVGSSIQGPASP